MAGKGKNMPNFISLLNKNAERWLLLVFYVMLVGKFPYE